LLLKAVEPPLAQAHPTGTALKPPRQTAGVEAPALAVLAAPVAAAVAMALHQLLPSQPDALATVGLYVVLLEILGAGTLLLAAAQWAWRPLQPLVRHYSPLVAGAIAWLCIWDLLTLKVKWLPPAYLVFCPSPDLVLQGMVEDWQELVIHVYYSLRLLLTGYFVGVGLGLVWGVLMGWFRAIRFWGMPVMKLLGPLPATALIPVAMMLSARISTNAFYPGVLLVAYAVWFPVAMLTASGIRNVPTSYFDVARTLGAGRLYLIFRVAIPSALPSIFIGLFMGLGASFLTLVVAETVGVKSGLGWYVSWAQGWAVYGKVYAALVIMAAFFSTIMAALFKVRDRVLVWQKGVIKW
jgi:NitT/TauT family transport system permease protein